MRIEKSILDNLIHNETFARKTIPFFKSEYFNGAEKTTFEVIEAYVQKYNTLPAKEALLIDLANRRDLNEIQFNSSKEVIEDLGPSDVDTQWLIDQSEKFCQAQAIHNAILQSIGIVQENKNADGILDVGTIPKLMSDALGVTFDSHVGHDFIDNAEARYEFYHKKELRIPFSGIEKVMKITKGGLPQKTLNVIIASTGVGKSLFMCHCAADNLTMGKNVLYITLELAEEMVAQRIDANLLDVPINQIEDMPKSVYLNKMSKIRDKTKGKLIIKEYPPASVGSANFRHLINELRIKKNFVPDIIYIDYLNLCISSRIKVSPNTNSYTLIKAVSEELRGLGVEFKLPIVTATQTNRGGMNSSDIELTDIAESSGVTHTADFILGLISTEEMQEKNLYLAKQLKSRYGDIAYMRKFMIGVDKMKMRLYDIDDHDPVTGEIRDEGPVMDNTPMGKASMQDFNKKFFSDFK